MLICLLIEECGASDATYSKIVELEFDMWSHHDCSYLK
jgi:hypothetical protein